MANPLLDHILEASGGLNLWKKANTLLIQATMNGFFLQIYCDYSLKKRLKDKFKFQVKVKDVEDPMEYLVMIEDFPRKGFTGYFAPDICYILDKYGHAYKSRLKPRKAFLKGFRSLRRLIRWDELDTLYFIGYAVYNSFLTPYIFTFNEVKTKELKRVNYPPVAWSSKKIDEYEQSIITENKKYETGKFRVLRVVFPERIPTHHPIQTFYIYDGGERNNLIHSMECCQEIGGLIPPYLVHYELGYEDSNSINAENVKTRNGPLKRRAYMSAQIDWFWKYILGAEPIALFGDIDYITYQDINGKTLHKEEFVELTNL